LPRSRRRIERRHRRRATPHVELGENLAERVPQIATFARDRRIMKKKPLTRPAGRQAWTSEALFVHPSV
jgi:hypothetical protein